MRRTAIPISVGFKLAGSSGRLSGGGLMEGVSFEDVFCLYIELSQRSEYDDDYHRHSLDSLDLLADLDCS